MKKSDIPPPVSQVSIQPATIQLKVVTVNNRSMTYALFKQLPEEDFFDESFGIIGIRWGRINYFWGDHKDATDTTLHILWQKGDELRRCIIYKPKSFNHINESILDLANHFERLGFPTTIDRAYLDLKLKLRSNYNYEGKPDKWESDSDRQERHHSNQNILQSEDYQPIYSSLKQLHQNCVNLYLEMKEIPQLFIAVG
ncbi:hypothetical protein [Spirosoma aerophilum]